MLDRPENGRAATTAKLVRSALRRFLPVFLLKNRHVPDTAAGLPVASRPFSTASSGDARRLGHDPEAIYGAKVRALRDQDEVILGSAFSVRDEWERQPLQLELFGELLAGDRFFEKLEQLRGRADNVEVLRSFTCACCSVSGAPSARRDRKARLSGHPTGEQIAHIRGKRQGFAPHWPLPDRISHELGRELPLWILATLTALTALGAFSWLNGHLGAEVEKALGAYEAVISESAAVPRLVITLP